MIIFENRNDMLKHYSEKCDYANSIILEIGVFKGVFF